MKYPFSPPRHLWIPLLLFTTLPSAPAPRAALPAPEAERPPLVLGEGEQRSLRIQGLSKFSLGSPIVRAVRTDPQESQLMIKGVSPGQTDLWVWKTDGGVEHRLIRVEKLAPSELSSPLVRALSTLKEVEILYSGAAVILRGTILSLDESIRLAAVVRGFPKEVIDETTPSETLMDTGQTALAKAFRERDFEKSLRIERIGNDLWVRGSLPSPKNQEAARKLIASVFPRARVELLAPVDDAPTVHFKVFLLELKKNRFSSFGLAWPAAQEGAFHVSPSAVRESVGLDLTLQALEGDGSARILSKPELVVRAPGDAELFAGGELPLLTRNRFYSDVSWKNYGLTLKLHVVSSTRDQVRVDILTEISHLDPTTAMESVPGIQSNRMKTQVDARYGVPLLLSGLLQQGTRENAKGLPMLRRIPILGALFGSDDYLNERSELVAILVPSLTPPEAPMERVSPVLPKGPVPPPRNWLSFSQIQALKASPEYPWNAFQPN